MIKIGRQVMLPSSQDTIVCIVTTIARHRAGRLGTTTHSHRTTRMMARG